MKSGVVEAVASESSSSSLSKVRERVRDYVLLTKPRIVMLFGLTGASAMVIEGSLRADPMRFWMIFLGMVLTAGSANALNQYIDRDIDALMERTRKKRPLPAGRLKPQSALMFALLTGSLATWLLYHFGGALASGFGVFTIAFYVGIYTMWLKRLTPYNIVIGGAAGATAPLIGWAAATGTISLGAFIMFLIIFMWTPPHFWALALCVRDEYAAASVPMLPVVKGEEETRRQMLLYTLALVPLSLLLKFTGDCGWLYTISATALGYEFIRKAKAVTQLKDERTAWRMFGYSIVYLLALYVVMIIDALVR